MYALKRSLAIGCLTVVFFGCGTEIMPAPPADEPAEDRLVVNDGLRLACPPLSDEDIKRLLLMCETHRLDGYTKAEELADAAAACAPTNGSAACRDCYFAIVEQVHE